MKITRVEALPIDRYLFVQVHTDEGITGLGSPAPGATSRPRSRRSRSSVATWWGRTRVRIEHHWNVMYRIGHFRGAAIMGALSAIDIALWDIKGKALGVPVYDLLGGRCRDKARVYFHVFGNTTETLVRGCVEAKEAGYTAVGHLTPFLDESRDVPYFKTHAAKIRDAIETVRRYREAVGDSVDLCIEIHRRLTPAEAVVLARGIEPFHPMFYEDPILPDNFDAMGLVAQQIAVPIATGERLHTIYEFEMLLARGAVQYVRPDVCLCRGDQRGEEDRRAGGGAPRGVVPHNPLPGQHAACLQVAAASPTSPSRSTPPGRTAPPRARSCRRGALRAGLPDHPRDAGDRDRAGPDAREKYPPRPRPTGTRLHLDGSVVDQ